MNEKCPQGFKFVGIDEKTGLPWCQVDIPPELSRLGAMVERNWLVILALGIGLVLVLALGGGRRRR